MKATNIKYIKPKLFADIMLAVKAIEKYLDFHQISFCDFAFDIEAVLKDQQNYYLENYNSIKRGIEPPATELADALSL